MWPHSLYASLSLNVVSNEIFAIFVDLARIEWARDQVRKTGWASLQGYAIMHAWSVGTMSISTICRARDQVRETRSECLQGYAWLQEYLISRNNFNNVFFNYFQSTWPSTWAGVGGGLWAASWWRPDRLCNFYRPDPAPGMSADKTSGRSM